MIRFRPLEKIRAVRDGLVAAGVDKHEADVAMRQFGDGTILKLLLEHSGDIAAVVKLILGLFGK